jgi:hypothetical protein
VLRELGERNGLGLLGSCAEEQHALFVGLDEQRGGCKLGRRSLLSFFRMRDSSLSFGCRSFPLRICFVFTQEGDHGERHALQRGDALFIQHRLADLEVQCLQGGDQRGARIRRRKLLADELRIERKTEYARQAADQP